MKTLVHMQLDAVATDEGVIQAAHFRYVVDEDGSQLHKALSVPVEDLGKVIHDQGVAGELWFDLVAQVNAAEGI